MICLQSAYHTIIVWKKGTTPCMDSLKKGEKNQKTKQGLLRLSRNKPFSNQYPSVLTIAAERRGSPHCKKLKQAWGGFTMRETSSFTNKKEGSYFHCDTVSHAVYITNQTTLAP